MIFKTERFSLMSGSGWVSGTHWTLFQTHLYFWWATYLGQQNCLGVPKVTYRMGGDDIMMRARDETVQMMIHQEGGGGIANRSYTYLIFVLLLPFISRGWKMVEVKVRNVINQLHKYSTISRKMWIRSVCMTSSSPCWPWHCQAVNFGANISYDPIGMYLLSYC